MLRKVFMSLSVATMLILGVQMFAFGQDMKFKVRIENIAKSELTTAGDAKYPFAVSPGLFVVSKNKMDLFKAGKKAHEGLEAQAEDGNPELLAKELLTKIGSANMGIFNMPVGADMPAPILPNGAFEFTFMASKGMKLNLIAMYGQSNDLFYAPQKAIDLFDDDGNVLTGDITDKMMLWDAGTEVNQAPGIGDEQAPRQKMANSGTAENGKIGLIKDSFMYPNTKDVLKVTITKE